MSASSGISNTVVQYSALETEITERLNAGAVAQNDDGQEPLIALFNRLNISFASMPEADQIQFQSSYDSLRERIRALHTPQGSTAHLPFDAIEGVFRHILGWISPREQLVLTRHVNHHWQKNCDAVSLKMLNPVFAAIPDLARVLAFKEEAAVPVIEKILKQKIIDIVESRIHSDEAYDEIFSRSNGALSLIDQCIAGALLGTFEWVYTSLDLARKSPLLLYPANFAAHPYCQETREAVVEKSPAVFRQALDWVFSNYIDTYLKGPGMSHEFHWSLQENQNQLFLLLDTQIDSETLSSLQDKQRDCLKQWNLGGLDIAYREHFEACRIHSRDADVFNSLIPWGYNQKFFDFRSVCVPLNHLFLQYLQPFIETEDIDTLLEIISKRGHREGFLKYSLLCTEVLQLSDKLLTRTIIKHLFEEKLSPNEQIFLGLFYEECAQGNDDEFIRNAYRSIKRVMSEHPQSGELLYHRTTRLPTCIRQQFEASLLRQFEASLLRPPPADDSKESEDS